MARQAAGRRVALFGNASYDLIAGGTGSGDVNRAYTIAPARGLAEAGFAVNQPLSDTYSQYIKKTKAGLPKRESILSPPVVVPDMLPDAALCQQQAQAPDVAVLTLSRNAGEGGDRKEADDFTLTATEQALLKRVTAAFHAQGKKVVVVLNIGGVIETASWRNQVDAILLAW